MTALRNTAITAAHDTSRALLDALDSAGYEVGSITLSETHLSVHLAHGTAQAAITALGLTVENPTDYPADATHTAFSAANCTVDAIRTSVLGDYDPQVRTCTAGTACESEAPRREAIGEQAPAGLLSIEEFDDDELSTTVDDEFAEDGRDAGPWIGPGEASQHLGRQASPQEIAAMNAAQHEGDAVTPCEPGDHPPRGRA